MVVYLEKVKDILSDFGSHEIIQIPKEQEDWADTLADLASTIDQDVKRAHPNQIPEQVKYISKSGKRKSTKRIHE